MIVREYHRDADFEGIRACLIELQEFERRIDRRMPAGDEIANAYISEALAKCAECHGRIFVADQGVRLRDMPQFWLRCAVVRSMMVIWSTRILLTS